MADSAYGAGSAEKENAKYLESVQGHLDQLQAKWESFSTSIADSAGLKMFIDLGGGVISVLDKLTQFFGSATMVAMPFIASMSKLGNIGNLNMPSYSESCRMMAA